MKHIFKSLILVFLGLFSAFAMAKPWVEWKKQGAPTIQSSQINHHAERLLPYHEGQKARANCGIAATVTALNSLALSSPVKFLGIKLFSQAPIFSQTNFFSPQVERIVK